MQRFDFPLDRLLKIKRQLEQIAEQKQQRAGGEVAAAEAALRGLHDQLTRMSDRMVAAVGRPTAAGQWAVAAGQSEWIGQAIRAAEGEVAAAGERLRAAADERAALATEVEALATLRGQRWERWRHEAQKIAQEQLDELGLRRWQAARDEAAGPESP